MTDQISFLPMLDDAEHLEKTTWREGQPLWLAFLVEKTNLRVDTTKRG